VRWLRARAGEVGIDAARMAPGASPPAATWLPFSALTGADMDGEITLLRPPTEVETVVAWYAPTELAAIAADTGADPMGVDSHEAQLLGAPVPTVPQLALQAGPVSCGRPGAPPTY
jgi:hypothetical protein